MDNQGFHDFLDSEIKLLVFSEAISNSAALAQFATKELEESNEIADITLGSASLIIGPRRRRLRVDGLGIDEIDGTLFALISDAVDKTASETLTKTDADALFSQLHWFIEVAVNDKLRSEIPTHDVAAEFAWRLGESWGRIQKVKLVLATNKTLSERVRTYEFPSIGGKNTEAQIWDEKRLFELFVSKTGHEKTQIKLSDFGSEPIPMLSTAASDGDSETYLAVVPGDLLARIFDKYGSRLLEGNVRGFLSTRGNVNKGIRATILGRPEKFLIFNNGITATASSIEVDSQNRLLQIEDLQIVNGGQTTASLYTFLKQEKALQANLRKTAVAMKLIVVKPEIAEEMVPEVAKYSNSQNKVNEADFFANSPFHRRMEEISKRLMAPAVGGRQTSTRWYYERARGSFENEKARASLTSSGAKKFEDTYPKGQKIDKTDLAKFHNIVNLKPHLVRRGNQKNFVAFKDEVATKYESEEGRALFGDAYYKRIVCTKIMFDALHKAVRDSTWYTQGYLADLVTYGMAKFIQSAQDDGYAMPWDQIWQLQSLPQTLANSLLDAAELASVALLDPTRKQQNVTEWAKSEDCWKSLKALEYKLSPEVKAVLVTKEAAAAESKENKKIGKLLNEYETKMYLNSIPHTYWEQLLVHQTLRISPSTRQVVDQVIKGNALVLDKRRANSLMELIEQASFEGIESP